MKLPCRDCIVLPICLQRRSKFGVYNDVYVYSGKCSLLKEYLRGSTPPEYHSFDANRLHYAVGFFLKLKYQKHSNEILRLTLRPNTTHRKEMK